MFRLINAWVLMLHIDCLMASLIIIIIIIIIYSDDTGQRRRKAGYIYMPSHDMNTVTTTGYDERITWEKTRCYRL